MPWQPISSAPPDTPVLAYHPLWEMMQIGVRDAATGFWQGPSGDVIGPPQLWRPLPDHPAQPAEGTADRPG